MHFKQIIKQFNLFNLMIQLIKVIQLKFLFLVLNSMLDMHQILQHYSFNLFIYYH